MSTNTFVPEHLKKWSLSGWDNNYGGEDLSEWYILIARTRDSNILENSNFESIQRDLKQEGFEISGDVEEPACILLASFGHWAVGWIESLMIHESNIKALKWAEEVKGDLEGYPIYDEQDYYDREHELIWNDIKEYYVKEYLDDNNLEYTDQMLDDLTSELYRYDNIDWSVNDYDEVIPHGDNVENLLADMTEEYTHLKTCPVCDTTFNPDKTACNCQMTLPSL